MTKEEFIRDWQDRMAMTPLSVESVLAYINERESAVIGPTMQDAQRYVWWCDPSNDIPSAVFYQGKPVIDAFIDGAKKPNTERKP